MAPTPFDLIVITSSNPVQLQLFQLELAALPQLKGCRILAVCDPQGHRVGSGGGTLNALVAANAHVPVSDTSRILILHSGGDSQRSPLCSVQGKAFSSLPHLTHATPLAFLLEVLASVTHSPGVIVSSTDVILHLPDLQPTELSANCVAGLGIYTPLEYGTRHGVFAPQTILQKATVPELRAAGFMGDEVLLDSGVIFFGPQPAKELLALATLSPYSGSTFLGLDQGNPPYRFELYTDILFSLPMFYTSEEPTLLSIALSQADFTVIEAPRTSRFVHSGTTLELLTLATNPPPFVSFARRVHSLILPNQDVHASAVIINSLLRGTSLSRVDANAVVEHCDLFGTFRIGSNAVASRISELPGLVLPPSLCLQQIELESKRFVFPCFGVFDTVKDERGKGGTFMNVDWDVILDIVPAQAIWPEGTSPVRNLWTAKLFPIIDPSQPAQRDAALFLLYLNDDVDRFVLAAWQALPRLALKDLALVFDPHAFFAHRQTLLPALILQRAWANTLAVSVPIPRMDKSLMATLDSLLRLHAGDCVALARLTSIMGDLLGTDCDVKTEGDANALFTEAFGSILSGATGALGINRLLQVRDQFLHGSLDRARAAAHMNRLSQLLVHKSMESPNTDKPLAAIKPMALDVWVHASCPGRIDLGGGWSDTPPVTYEHGGAVTNLAILVEGQHPLGASCRLVATRRIDLWLGKYNAQEKSGLVSLSSAADFAGFDDPGAPGALLKCVLLSFFNGNAEALLANISFGFELCAWSALPVGSGLGGSSILAACAVGVVAKALGLIYSRMDVVQSVLTVEQLLSSGGGWQDQIGGIFPGAKLARCKRGLPVRLEVEIIPISNEFKSALQNRVVLLNTGKARLARDLLQKVLKKWARRDLEMVGCVDELVGNAERGAQAIEKGDVDALAGELGLFWRLKRTIAGPASEPEHVTGLFSVLEETCSAMGLCGAGGGGFAVVFLRPGVEIDALRKRVALWNTNGSGPEVVVKRVEVCERGLVVWE